MDWAWHFHRAYSLGKVCIMSSLLALVIGDCREILHNHRVGVVLSISSIGMSIASIVISILSIVISIASIVISIVCIVISIASIVMTIGLVSIGSTIVPMAIDVTISTAFRGVVSFAGMFGVGLAIIDLPLMVFLLPYVVVQSNRLV
jgi:hypothetical protein